MSAVNDAELQSLRHLHALRNFIGNLVEQAEKSGGCECHKPPSLLLVGPPGAGKTYLVKQMSKVCEMPLFGVHTHQVANAASIKKLFLQARENFPSLVFLDDVDSIFADHEEDKTCSPSVRQIREEIFSELGPRKLKIHDPDAEHNPTQQQIQSSPGSSSSRASSRSSSLSRARPSAPELNDSYDESLYPDNNGIIVVAATSAPWLLYKDHELLSRFRGVYLVGLPDRDSRYALLQTLMRELHHNLTDQQIGEVADKTQGFTPADLMVVMKTLSYRQFSFLLSMTNGREGSQGNSTSASPTPTSSDLTEQTGSDTDIDGLSEPKNKTRGSETGGTSGTTAAAAVAAASLVAAAHENKKQNADKRDPTSAAAAVGAGSSSAGAMGHPSEHGSPAASGEGLLSRAAAAGIAVAAVGAAAATVTALNNDWTSDSEEESGRVTQRARVPSGVDSVSPDSGMILSRSSEEAIPRLDQPDSGPPQTGEEQQHSHQSLPPTDDDLLQQRRSSHSHDSVLRHSETGQHHREGHNDSLQSNASRSSASVDDSGENDNFKNEINNDDNRELHDAKDSDGSESVASQSENIKSSRGVEDYTKKNTESSNNFSSNDFVAHNSIDTNSFYESKAVDNSCESPSSLPHASPNEDSNDTLQSIHNEFPNMSPASHRSNSPGADSYYENNVYDDEHDANIPTLGEDGVDATGCTETEEILVHTEYKNLPSPKAKETSKEHLDDGSISPPEQFAHGEEDTAVPAHSKSLSHESSSNEDRSVELHYSEPPDPMRDDNLAVDSDSDNESPVMRPRRVGFANRPVAIDPLSGGGGGGNGFSNRSPTMNSLSVDCGSSDMPPNISLDALGGSGALNNGGSDNILRQLLSRPSHTNTNGGSPCHGSSPGCSPTPPVSPAPSNCSSGAATLASSGSGRGSPQHLMQQDLHHTPLHQTEDLHDRRQRQSTSSGGLQRPRQQSPLRQRNERQSPLHHSPLHTSPHHQSSHHNSPHHNSPHHQSSRHNSPLHQSSHHNSPHHQSSHHQSPHLQASPIPRSNLENGSRKDDEDQCDGVKTVTGLGAAAAAATVATAVSNGPTISGVTEDDMAKLIDALEMQLDGGARGGLAVPKGSDGEASDDSDDESVTDDEDDDEKAALMALDEMGTVGIQPITLADVLDVISKGYRSVSDEEINKYTEFMVWFANVAKSACPHNNGSRSEAPTLDEGDDDFGVESTLCATPSLLKRNQRRKPLKKLGKFLLKALMFILD